MNTKFKITAAVLSAGLIITPLSGLVQNNQNIAKASDLVSKKTNSENSIQKHIDYIDSQIYLANNHLIVNKEQVLKYLKQNWNEINKNTKLNTPEEYLNSIKLSISNINEKVSSGWYKFDNQKGIKERFKARSNGGFEAYYYWWGSQVYIHNKWELNNFKREIEDYIYRLDTLAIVTTIASLGVTVYHSNELKRMLTLVDRTYNDYGSVKITTHDFRIGDMFEVEPIQ